MNIDSESSFGLGPRDFSLDDGLTAESGVTDEYESHEELEEEVEPDAEEDEAVVPDDEED